MLLSLQKLQASVSKWMSAHSWPSRRKYERPINFVFDMSAWRDCSSKTELRGGVGAGAAFPADAGRLQTSCSQLSPPMRKKSLDRKLTR